MWPRHKAKVDVIAKNMERHALLLSDEVNLEHIRETHDARIAALEHYERERDFQERQDYEALESYITPTYPDAVLSTLVGNVSPGSGRWLDKENLYSQWLNPANKSVKLLWLQGIPGAGKSQPGPCSPRVYVSLNLFTIRAI
jgi:hypothetical protein